MAEECDYSIVPGYSDAKADVQEWYHQNGCDLINTAKEVGKLAEESNLLADDYNAQFERYAPLLLKFSNAGYTPSQPNTLEPVQNLSFNEIDFSLSVDNMRKSAPTYVGGHAPSFGEREGGVWMPTHWALVQNLEIGERLKSWTPSVGTNPDIMGSPESSYFGIGSKFISPEATATEAAEGDEMCETLWPLMKAYMDKVDQLTQAMADLFLLWEELEHVITRSEGARATEGGLLDLWTKSLEERRAAAEERARAAEELEEARKAADAIEWKSFKKILFKEQCFLLAKIFDIVLHKWTEEGNFNAPQIKKLPYYSNAGQAGARAPTNACLQMEGDPFGFINVLTQHPSQAAFFDMQSAEIASLQPMIRLFKVGTREEIVDWDTIETAARQYEQEFMFDAAATAADVKNVFTTKAKRGFGVGIKKFSFTYDGNNPFAAKKSIKAKLQIHANSFSELLSDRGGYNYAELALKTGGTTTKGAIQVNLEEAEKCAIAEENLAKLNFRLKAVVGWARPTGNSDIFKTKSAGQQRHILEAIANSYVTLNLTPTTHEFDIDEFGRVTFTINYLAYTDDFFDQAHFNIFYDRTSAKPILERRLLYKSLDATCSSEKLTELKEAYAKNGAIAEEKRSAMRSLMRRMREANRIKYVSLTYDELIRFNTEGPFFEPDNAVIVENASTSLGTVSKELEEAFIDKYSETRQIGQDPNDKVFQAELTKQKEIIRVALEANNPDVNHVSFFYVSDLVDTILEGLEGYLQTYSEGGDGWDEMRDPNIMEEFKVAEAKKITKFYDNFKTFRAVLGPMEIVNPKNPHHAEYISLGDVPISVKYFIEWLTERLSTRDQVTYSLSKFLNDFFNNLIRNFLNNDQCFTFNTKQKIRLNQAVITGYKQDKLDWETGDINPSDYDEITDFIIEQTQIAVAQNPTLGVDPGYYYSRATIEEIRSRAYGIPLLNTSGPSAFPVTDGGIQNEINYLVFSAGRLRPREQMIGVRHVAPGSVEIPTAGAPKELLGDEEFGIFHYLVGRPRGIVKSIRLNKTEAPYLKEVRFEQEGYDGLEQLREVYDIQVDTYANVNTFPGTYIYVDPRSFAPETAASAGLTTDLTKYGIGGYCMIIRSEHNFGPGEASTTLTTKWVAGIASDEECEEIAPAADKGQANDTRCNILIERANRTIGAS